MNKIDERSCIEVDFLDVVAAPGCYFVDGGPGNLRTMLVVVLKNLFRTEPWSYWAT